MMEQAEVQSGAHAPKMPVGRALSDEVRASLEAVRVAQEAARARARSQTTRTRLWFVALLGAAVVAGLAVAPRVARWRHARAKAVTPARSAPALALPAPAPAPAPALPPQAPAAEKVIASAASTPAPEPVATNRSAPPPPAAAEEKNSRPGAVGGDSCDAGLIRKTPWLLSPEACARAFEADPNNAALALAIAHAEHVRGHVAETAQWAGRAIALDANLAEAYVLIARAHTDSGRSDEARAAYQRYIELAPRGWHQAEARAGGRRSRATASPDSTRGR